MPPRYTLTVASLLMAAAVALGALDAHALSTRLAGSHLAIWRTAVTYHAWHALALLAIGVLQRTARARRGLALGTTLLVVGIVLFSGSLYLIALGAARGWAYLTPVGGVAFLAGWLVLAVTLAPGVRRV